MNIFYRGGSEETIDVYSFGLFLLELITCQNPGLLQSDYEVLQWVRNRKKKPLFLHLQLFFVC